MSFSLSLFSQFHPQRMVILFLISLQFFPLVRRAVTLEMNSIG